MRIRTHPGEILLEEFLKPNNITPHGLALALGVPPTRIADIVHQRRGLSADTSIRLARFFGTSAEFWSNLQSAHDLSLVANELENTLERIVPLGERAQKTRGAA
ncbi:MAG: HigA family addiction module antidote protein [Desulfovibrio sp.]|nr:HigA family addiction module antidote protein [Desulfovibrio sp.]